MVATTATTPNLGAARMIFEVLPSQIEGLDSKELVELLRRLLHSEALLAGIEMSSVSVPMQITVADGGEDARVKWEGGLEKTDHLPTRFTVFQSKASDPGKAGWMKEVWSKASQKAGTSAGSKRKRAKGQGRRTSKPKLNDAVANVLAAQGAYIGFTSVALVGSKPDEYAKAIAEGITQAGGDPGRLAAIHVYDANKIAAWASRHPAVGLWVNERQSRLSLGGFQTISEWGERSGIRSIQLVEDVAPRFVLGGRFVDEIEDDSQAGNRLTAQQAKERIFDHLMQSRATVRLYGPSGIGKTRFLYELLNSADSTAKLVIAASAIYCDYRAVGQGLLGLASTIARLRVPAMIIADECPLEVAKQLEEIADVTDRGLRILTIDLSDTPLRVDRCLNLAVGPGDNSLIDGIVRGRLAKATNAEVDYIRNVCGGFPRIAVLATDSYSQRSSILGSIGDVVDRILVGSGVTDKDDLRAVEILALFDRLGIDADAGSQIDYVAQTLAGTTGDRMYESLARASKHQLVDRRHRHFTAQPFPIAIYIGLRRLDLMRAESLLRFIDSAPEPLLQSMFRQWRSFDNSRVAVRIAEHLLSVQGKFGSAEALCTAFGAECVDMLTHVVPDASADTLERVFGSLSLDELKSIGAGRRAIVSALEKLAFRAQSFPKAARLLLCFAAAENESFSNNATGQFTQLFNLYLSGTEAEPAMRFALLDEGLASNDQRVIAVCVGALERTLHAHHFTRSGDVDVYSADAGRVFRRMAATCSGAWRPGESG